MKDTIITARRKKTELITLLACFILANVVNLCSVIKYRAPFSELLTSLGYVLVVTIFLYVVWTLIRVVFYGVKLLFTRDRTE